MVVIDKSVTLSGGDICYLRLGKDHIVYAGMPSENLYSIVEMKWDFFIEVILGHYSIPKNQSRIRIDSVNILVESVTSNEIRLKVG